ncbi:MAG: hypothetical protein QOF51_3717 [Chloroflexota bacterium]|jgi:hypothetical protein|nr:hypothetical protein [Chloroflexota bacterium]
MASGSTATVIPFPRRSAAALPAGTAGELRAQARAWTERIADAADADQWAIAVVGIKRSGPPDFEELMPRPLLEGLNSQRPAVYRLTLVLRAGARDIGIVRLGTLRPCGFSAEETTRARAATDAAAQALIAISDARRPARAQESHRGADTATIRNLARHTEARPGDEQYTAKENVG